MELCSWYISATCGQRDRAFVCQAAAYCTYLTGDVKRTPLSFIRDTPRDCLNLLTPTFGGRWLLQAYALENTWPALCWGLYVRTHGTVNELEALLGMLWGLTRP